MMYEVTVDAIACNKRENSQGQINSEEHERFFTEMLGDIDEATLPFGLKNNDQDGGETDEAYLMLSQQLYNLLQEQARNLQVSLASICHLAWAQVLAKASGRESVVFGTVLAGLSQPGQSNNSVMRPMINILPLRLDIDDRGVESAVRHAHARLSSLLSAHKHASLPLAQRCSGVVAGMPLFSSLLNYHRSQMNGTVESFSSVRFAESVGGIKYPLTLSLDDTGSSVSLTVQVESPISAARVCAYMQRTLESLAVAISRESQESIRSLPVMPSEERTLLLHTWNQTAVLHSSTRCLHELFEEQVDCNGDATAVECVGRTLSYSELNLQANRLAHLLISKGVKPDDRIALCVDRGTSLVVAMLGILKAGCAYVPLDPIYPSQRLTNILNDAEPKFLLADESGRQALGKHQIPVIDVEKPLSTHMPITNPNPMKLRLTPAHLAYIIYTSGSTGTPKGVMVEHRQAVQLFETTRDNFDFNKQDKWCLFHSISFDVCTWEIFGALLHRSQLSIVPIDIVRSPEQFYGWINGSGITVLNQTPSAFKLLMRARNINSRLDCLRYVILGGEVLDPMILKVWYEENVDCRTIVVNMYGPTETVINTTMFICDSQSCERSVVPIGRPISNKRIYLLDSYGEPVLLGAVGEIYIGGDSVARGYLNHPALTKKHFLPDPFRDDPAARMYRTGDLAKYLPNGNLVFSGRADQQVKVRGFRIELGEIGARLAEHPQVYEAAVDLYDNGSATCLVAYVVSDEIASLAQTLRNYLSTLLPDYMVPAAYVRLLSLPLTPNGKLNRRALPAPDNDSYVRQQYEAPQGEVEEKLAHIWRELLGIDRISRHDNFFSLGGHSLLIVRLLAQLRDAGFDTTTQQMFDAPSLATLAETLTKYKAISIPPNLIVKDSTKITPEMLPLITLTQADIAKIVAHVPGGVSNIQDIYGLTPLQSGMLYHHLMAKEVDPYLLVRRMRFIDRASLENYTNSWRKVIERHDILRTAIFWDGINEPAQVVLREVSSPLTEIVSEKLDPRHHKLDLTEAPHFRLVATQESDDSFMVQQLMHHSTIDHSTMERLQAEISDIIKGKIEISTTPIPFRNFVAQIRSETNLDDHTRFFTEMLRDIDEPTLPFGLNEVEQNEADMNESCLKLPESLNDHLRMYARKFQVSLASICHLAWALVLSKASGQELVVFGTVLLGRLQAGVTNNSIMGPTINTLPLRLEIDDERSVESVVRDTHTRLSALFAHENASLALAQRCSSISAGLPLFSALLNYRHHKDSGTSYTSLPGISLIDNEGRTNYPLIISLDDEDDSLSMSVEVASSISAVRICAYMQQALESLVDAMNHTPQIPVRMLTVLPPEERNQLLHDWNQTKTWDSRVSCLHQLVEAQVDCHSDTIAVEYEGDTLTYSQLNVRANRLAHYLIANGVKPDSRIALCVERGTSMIAAMLGILKAGCAYLPLDPAYPSQRLIDILHDADPIFLLADSNGRKILGDHQVPTIDLEKPLPTDLPTDNPNAAELGLTPNHLAYVIYTSGSTGTPKGVMIEHQHVVRYFEAIRNVYGCGEQNKWSMFHSMSFDTSIFEIWGSLLYVNQLSIVPNNIAYSADELYHWICINRINLLIQTPSAFKVLIQAKNFSSRSDALKCIILGGEALDASVVREWYGIDDSRKTMLINAYGPTEITVDASIWICDDTFSKYSTMPIGRPLNNKRIYLLDRWSEPVPIGAEGEIYIGGEGIARGYLNRPDLTVERFLPDPFSDNPPARMYRTGDLAKYFSDGNIMYYGRADQQVKIRGFRIELGEIEARLVEHAQVHEAVVQSHSNGSDAYLVAYVVADEDASLLQNLRSYLSTLLPAYMVPTAYVCLPRLPLTPSGKLNKQALPAPNDEAFVRQKYEAPQGEIEEQIATIWHELLNIERISRHDNFFELGGHSLHVMQFVNKAKLNSMHIDVRGVFSFPILKNLAEEIINRNNRLYCDTAIPVRQHGDAAPLFLLPDCEGDVSYAFELAHDIDKSIPVYVLPWASPEKRYPSSLEEMARAMIEHMMNVQPNGPYAIAGYSGGGFLAFEMAKQLVNGGYQVSFLGLIDTFARIVKASSETDIFLSHLQHKLHGFEVFNDPVWWNNISKSDLSEAIAEIKNAHVDLTSSDIEWRTLLAKQCYNYQNLCSTYKIESFPVKIHLFMAKDRRNLIEIDKKWLNCPKNGWEIYDVSSDFDIISIDGDHFTMITDSKNRSALGEELTKCLQSK